MEPIDANCASTPPRSLSDSGRLSMQIFGPETPIEYVTPFGKVRFFDEFR